MAEVLITLGIIGVVAALTMPVLIGKLIPVGTGAKKYRKANYSLELDNLKEEPLEALEQELLD